jgi:hypothetical protein
MALSINQLQTRNLIGLYSHQPSIFYYKITSFVYPVKMADDDRFASISEAEMHEIKNNTMGVTTVFLYVVIIHRFQAHDTLSMDMTYNKRC